jgi:hypothetical protein
MKPGRAASVLLLPSGNSGPGFGRWACWHPTVTRGRAITLACPPCLPFSAIREPSLRQVSIQAATICPSILLFTRTFTRMPSLFFSRILSNSGNRPETHQIPYSFNSATHTTTISLGTNTIPIWPGLYAHVCSLRCPTSILLQNSQEFGKRAWNTPCVPHNE